MASAVPILPDYRIAELSAPYRQELAGKSLLSSDG